MFGKASATCQAGIKPACWLWNPTREEQLQYARRYTFVPIWAPSHSSRSPLLYRFHSGTCCIGPRLPYILHIRSRDTFLETSLTNSSSTIFEFVYNSSIGALDIIVVYGHYNVYIMKRFLIYQHVFLRIISAGSLQSNRAGTQQSECDWRTMRVNSPFSSNSLPSAMLSWIKSGVTICLSTCLQPNDSKRPRSANQTSTCITDGRWLTLDCYDESVYIVYNLQGAGSHEWGARREYRRWWYPHTLQVLCWHCSSFQSGHIS